MADLVHCAFLYDIRPLVSTFYVEDAPRRRYGDDHEDEDDIADAGDTLPAADFVPSLSARQVFGTNLRRARRLLNLSQQQFAARAGVSRSYLGEIEYARHNIGINRMEDLARALGLQLGDLLDAGLYTPGRHRRDN